MESPGQETHVGPEARPLDLFDLWAEFRRGFWKYSLLVVAGGAIGATLGLTLPKTYRAEVTVLPVDTRSASSGLASILGQYGGVASAAGLSMLNRSGDSVIALATLQSRELTGEFVRANDLKPVLFWKKWDAAGKTWKVDDPADVPSDWDVYRKFEKQLRSVTEDKRTGLVRIAIQWRDAEQAAAWANGLVTLADARMRERSIHESEARIALLNVEIQKNPPLGVQQGIYRLIETEIQRIALAKSANDFSFSIIDPAVVPDPDAQQRPRPALYTLLGLVAGSALCGLLILVRVLRATARR